MKRVLAFIIVFSAQASMACPPPPVVAPWWYPVRLEIVVGTYISGTLEDVQEDNGVKIEMGEVSGTPGHQYEFTFIGIPSDRRPGSDLSLLMNGFYNGNPSDNSILQAFNNDTATWDAVTGAAEDFPPDVSDQDYEFVLNGNLSSDFFTSGIFRCRIFHTTSGNPIHEFVLDLMKLDPPDASTPCEATIAHWKMNDNAADTVVEDSAGTFTGTFNDAGGNPNTDAHTTGGAASLTNESLSFDGIDDFIDVGDDIDDRLFGLTEISVAFWMNPSGVIQNMGMVGFGLNVSRQVWIFAQTPDMLRVILNTSAIGGDFGVVNGFIEIGEWKHVAISWTGSVLSLYENGSLLTTTTMTGSLIAGSDDNFIGKLALNIEFLGDIDDVRVFDRALTSIEVLDIYNNGLGFEDACDPPLPDPEVGVCDIQIHHWTMDDNADDYFVLDSQNDDDGRLNDDLNPVTSSHTVTGVIDEALTLDGEDDWIDFGTSPGATLFVQDADFAVSGWFKMAASTTDSCILSRRDASTDTIGLLIEVLGTTDTATSGQVRAVFDFGSGDTHSLFADERFDDDAWHFWVAQREGFEVSLWVDVDTSDSAMSIYSTGSLTGAFASLFVGSNEDNTDLLNGEVDDVRLFNDSLHRVNIEFLYADGSGTSQCAEVEEEVTTSTLCAATVAYWKMNDDAANTVVFEEEVGHDGVFNDATGDPNTDAHTTGGIHTTNTLTALEFDGVDDYVEVPNHADFQFPGAFSVTLWADLFTTSHNKDRTAIYMSDGASNTGFYIWADKVSRDWTFVVLGSGGTTSSIHSDDNTTKGWTFLVGTRDDAGAMQFFVNGDVQSSTASLAGAITTNGPLFFGQSRFNNRRLPGSLDEIRLFDRVISNIEISDLYNDGLGVEGCFATPTPTVTPSPTPTPTPPWNVLVEGVAGNAQPVNMKVDTSGTILLVGDWDIVEAFRYTTPTTGFDVGALVVIVDDEIVHADADTTAGCLGSIVSDAVIAFIGSVDVLVTTDTVVTAGNCLWLSQTAGRGTNVEPSNPAVSQSIGVALSGWDPDGLIRAFLNVGAPQ